MLEQFYNPHSIIAGILKLFVLLGIGYALNNRRILQKDAFSPLNNLLMWASLPALIITTITSSFKPHEFAFWWSLPLIAMIMIITGLGIGFGAQKCFKQLPVRREFICGSGFCNSGYLPMTLIAFTCHGTFCARLLVYIFLFIIGFNLLIWSFVPAFLSRRPLRESLHPKTLINPPLCATAAALLSVFLFGTGWVPSLIYDPLDILGKTTFPLALITLGAYLSEHKGHRPAQQSALAVCVIAKLILLPLTVFFIVKFMPIALEYKFFLFLEAIMPTAVTLVIIGHQVNADNKFLSGVIFYSHITALATIPIWLWVFKMYI